MKHKYLLLALTAAVACSKPTNLDTKKKELETARNEMISIKEKIGNLEKEIKQIDPSFSKNNNAVLISTLALEAKSFEHFVDMRGSVESKKNVTLSSQTGGKIQQVLVKEGQNVSSGQMLVILEADILRNSISEIKNALELANLVYEKQEKLWKQKIGTEIQYLQSKNNKESLEKKLATAYSQLDQTIIKAPFTGTVDRVNALVGEMASPGVPLVNMVNPNDMYVKADVSEEFIGRFATGDKVEIFFPAFDKKIKSTISSVGQVINSENRTFRVEVKLVSELTAKPNQVAIVSLRDYVNPKVIAVPTKIILRDSKGQFVFVVNNESTPKANKAYVKSGLSYDGRSEILEGLSGTETVIFEGFREVTEGAEVKIASQAVVSELTSK